MKSSILIVVLILTGLGLKANNEGKTVSYVKTENNVYFGQDVKMGLFNTKIISSDGTVTKVPYRDVVSYMDDSRLFEYLPVVCEKNDTTCYAMMEYVTTRSGLNLYRYCCYKSNEPKYIYYVYKGGDFHLRIDQKNAKTALPFFGIKVV
jgi:hypothetical protein